MYVVYLGVLCSAVCKATGWGPFFLPLRLLQDAAETKDRHEDSDHEAKAPSSAEHRFTCFRHDRVLVRCFEQPSRQPRTSRRPRPSMPITDPITLRPVYLQQVMRCIQDES
jgi:hypothetical protein